MNVRCLFFSMLFVLFFSAPAVAQQAAQIQLWRLDCGEMAIDDISYFSDAHLYDGQSAVIGNGCYLIQSGDQYLLWDAGLPTSVLGNTTPQSGWTSSLSITIVDQLAQLEIAPGDIDYLGVSHFHGDHIGQAADFSQAALLMSAADAEWIRENPPGNARRRLAPWFDNGGTITEFRGDHDVFGDGRAMILATPGHTPGHSALLVKLENVGAVLLTGDLYHFRTEIGGRNVSRWNTSRADTLASYERFEAIVEALAPTIIVQHDKGDIDKLPAFPKAAD